MFCYYIRNSVCKNARSSAEFLCENPEEFRKLKKKFCILPEVKSTSVDTLTAKCALIRCAMQQDRDMPKCAMIRCAMQQDRDMPKCAMREDWERSKWDMLQLMAVSEVDRWINIYLCSRGVWNAKIPRNVERYYAKRHSYVGVWVWWRDVPKRCVIERIF